MQLPPSRGPSELSSNLDADRKVKMVLSHLCTKLEKFPSSILPMWNDVHGYLIPHLCHFRLWLSFRADMKKSAC